MFIDIYVAAEGKHPRWDEPKLVIKSSSSLLPDPPSGRRWRYFATTTTDDDLYPERPFDVAKQLERAGYFFLL
jgi:hypothetical protein